nr:immunoglobulin heavy chain junction region [Macaca mulatta]MOX05771.1 immunoglobulin heavy chain junction region [Macaca mulatta]
CARLWQLGDAFDFW